MIKVVKSKLHRARVTGLCLDYEGSITLDPELLEAANIIPYEEVTVLNLNNGARFATYAIAGSNGGGTVELNGPAARLGCIGDSIIILSYQYIEEGQAPQPSIIYLNRENRVLSIKHEDAYSLLEGGRYAL